MWEPGGSSKGEGSTFTHDIHVLLVDHDKEFLISTANVLEACSYKVTAVERASTALSILSERKDEFDVVLVDIQLPDLDAFTLLRLTVNMELPAILMSEEEDYMAARRALENGAFLFLEKPVSMETLKYLWQHVMRERMRMNNPSGETGERRGCEMTDENGRRNGSKGKMPEEDHGSETNNKKEKDGVKKKVRSRKSTKKDEEYESENNCNGRVKRKICTEWTEELHEKFMDAINELGEGRCYPKEILELMNVPGLTRMQVASHLQKCRNDNWRAPEARRSHPPIVPTSSINDVSQPRINPRKFGSMPCLYMRSFANPQFNPQENEENNNRGPEIYAPPGNNFLGNEGGENMEQIISPQPQVLPHRYGSPPLTHNMQNMGQFGVYGTLSGVPNVDNANNGVEGDGDDRNEVSNEDGNEVSNVNGIENFYSTAVDMTYHQNYYCPILSDFSSATPGTDSHASSSNQKQLPPDDFFDFIPEMDDFVQNFYGLAQESTIDQCSRPQQNVFDFDQVFSEQLSVPPNGGGAGGRSTPFKDINFSW